jgi:hypothetical protein
MTLRLPLMWCAGCGFQLVGHRFVVVGTTDLVCGVCARKRVATGVAVAPVHPSSAGLVPGAGAPLPLRESLRLLVALGASPVAAGGAA